VVSVNRFTKASVVGALGAVLMWVLATFAFPSGVPVEIQTAVPLVAAYVAGVVVPHLPKGFLSADDEDTDK
jgi:hypothetical protein